MCTVLYILTLLPITNSLLLPTRCNFLRHSFLETNSRARLILYGDTRSLSGEPPSTRKNKNKRHKSRNPSKDDDIQTWRIFGVTVHPDDLISSTASASLPSSSNHLSPSEVNQQYLTPAVLQALCQRLKVKYDGCLPPEIQSSRVVRRSLDARKRLDDPLYNYVLDVDIRASAVRHLKEQSGRQERIQSGSSPDKNISFAETTKKKVIIVGAGPAGLFCALTLARNNIQPILLERGQPVESRGKDIGGLIHRIQLNPESNFCFGEGGAGTFSDGKLTTRIGRNSQAVRHVLETFVEYGAPPSILVEGAPHLGTDNLVRMMRNMRQALRDLGGDIRFGAKVVDLIVQEGEARGVTVEYSKSRERGAGRAFHEDSMAGTSETLFADAVVLATGHSARDFYEMLHHKVGVELEAKGFAAGFRVEHPQKLINEIQYGQEWGPSVITGKSVTDSVNTKHFGKLETDLLGHTGQLPVPSYRVATDKAYDGNEFRGAYSFCMCPGGQIVPASTNPDEVCVNGMSFSKRDSLWANSAVVVTIAPNDPILEPYHEEYGVLAGIAFQRDMERRASLMGGGNLTVPVQRLTDFIAGRPSTTAPPSSYRLGVKPAACHEIYPPAMTNALRDAIVNYFEKQLPGFLCEDGLLHAVETRTSSPVRISRDPVTLQAVSTGRLYPAGEGAGFAGGIVSAAIDGIVVADAALKELSGRESPSDKESWSSLKYAGYSY